MTFKKLLTDNPEWYQDDSFLRMTPQQRYRFRKAHGAGRAKTNKNIKNIVKPTATPQELPPLPPEIWLHVAEFLLSGISSKGCASVIQTLTSLMCCSREFYAIFSDNFLWKKVTRRLASLYDNFCIRISPPAEGDSWRRLALRLMPNKSHAKTCKNLYKTHVIKDHHISEDKLWGNLAFEKRGNPYNSSRPATLFRACAVKKLKTLFAAEVTAKENKILRLRARAADRRKAREDAVKEHGLDGVKFIDDPIDIYVNELFVQRLDSPLQIYLKRGSGWDRLLEAKTRFLELEEALKIHRLRVREDSMFCRQFVIYGDRYLSKVVDAMVEMDFMYNRTDYVNIFKSRLEEEFMEYDFLTDAEEDQLSAIVSKEVKREIYISLGREEIKNDMPDFIKRKIRKYRGEILP